MTFLTLIKPTKEPKLEPCVWRIGSTNIETGKANLPEFCKKAGCDGVKTEDVMRNCRRYTKG